MATLVFENILGGRRISFTEKTGFKFVDEVHNKLLVESFADILISTRKMQNKGKEPQTFKSKADAVFAIESNQREATNLMKDTELLQFKKRKLVIEVDQMELEKTNYLMEKCMRYEQTKYYNHWDNLLTIHLKEIEANVQNNQKTNLQNNQELESTDAININASQ